MKKILTDEQRQQVRKNKQKYEEKTELHPYTVRTRYDTRKAVKKLAYYGFCSQCEYLSKENENLKAKHEEMMTGRESVKSKVKSHDKKSTNANIEPHISNTKNSKDAAINRDYVIAAISSILFISYYLATITIL